jgi:hypothetical protein
MCRLPTQSLPIAVVTDSVSYTLLTTGDNRLDTLRVTAFAASV